MMSEPTSCIALIPARAGSKRVPNKNIRELGGHPLLAYSIAAALDSGVFAAVHVSTDSEEIAAIARHYGAETPFLRPAVLAGDLSPDIDWIEYTFDRLEELGRGYDSFAILRPTNPFRLPSTIRRAWQAFRSQQGVDSLRAVEKCSEHPGKMWVIRGSRLLPLLPFGPVAQPWHSTPYQALPEVYVQNASLEIAWTSVALERRSIAGEVLAPFLTVGDEGHDVNDPEDWFFAEHLLRSGQATLPPVEQQPFPLPETLQWSVSSG